MAGQWNHSSGIYPKEYTPGRPPENHNPFVRHAGEARGGTKSYKEAWLSSLHGDKLSHAEKMFLRMRLESFAKYLVIEMDLSGVLRRSDKKENLKSITESLTLFHPECCFCFETASDSWRRGQRACLWPKMSSPEIGGGWKAFAEGSFQSIWAERPWQLNDLSEAQGGIRGSWKPLNISWSKKKGRKALWTKYQKASQCKM